MPMHQAKCKSFDAQEKHVFSYVEYNLFVNDLSSSVDDATLFKLFGERYKSCRGAKIYRYPDGKSKGSGFIKFTSQTDQQMALV